MKKLFILLFLIVTAIPVLSQPSPGTGPKTFIEVFLTETRGIINDRDIIKLDNGVEAYFIKAALPIDYRLNKMTLTIKSMVDKYSDLYFDTVWVQVDDDLYRCILMAQGELVIVYYSEENTTVGFVY